MRFLLKALPTTKECFWHLFLLYLSERKLKNFTFIFSNSFLGLSLCLMTSSAVSTFSGSIYTVDLITDIGYDKDYNCLWFIYDRLFSFSNNHFTDFSLTINSCIKASTEPIRPSESSMLSLLVFWLSWHGSVLSCTSVAMFCLLCSTRLINKPRPWNNVKKNDVSNWNVEHGIWYMDHEK